MLAANIIKPFRRVLKWSGIKQKDGMSVLVTLENESSTGGGQCSAQQATTSSTSHAKQAAMTEAPCTLHCASIAPTEAALAFRTLPDALEIMSELATTAVRYSAMV